MSFDILLGNYDYTGTHDEVFPWRVRAASGMFAVGDRKYHLYGNKMTHTLAEWTVRSYELDYEPIPESVVITVDGQSYTQFTIDYKTVKIWQPDPLEWMRLYEGTWGADIAKRQGMALAGYPWDPVNTTVTISYDYKKLSGGSLIDQSASQNFQVEEGTLSYQKPHYYSGEVYPPVVMTDDCIMPDNARAFVPEFRIDHDDDVLELNQTANFLRDPGFCALKYDSTLRNPFWTESDVRWAHPFPMRDAYYGHNAFRIANGYNAVQTGVPIGSGESRVLSAYIRCSNPTGEAIIGFQFTDISGSGIGSYYEATGEAVDYWTRLEMEVTGTPSNAHRATVRVRNASAKTVLFDAIQFELGDEATQFSFVSPASTIEFEMDETGIYKNRTRSFDVDDVDLNPLRANMNRGFMTIGEYVDDPHDEPVGKGGYHKDYIAVDSFIVYRGTGEEPPSLDTVTLAIVQPPTDPNEASTNYLNLFSPGLGEYMYALLNVGSVYTGEYIYSNPFDSYPSGIQYEDWVGPEFVSGERVIDLSAGSGEWLDVLKWKISNLIISNGSLTGVYDFDGIMYENSGYAASVIPYIGDQSNEMCNLIRTLHEWIEGEVTDPRGLGLVTKLGAVRTGVPSASWIIDNIDLVMIDGVSINRNLEYNTILERNLLRSQALQMQYLASRRTDTQSTPSVLAVDYVDTRAGLLTGVPGSMMVIDEDTLRFSQDYIRQIPRWRYYIGSGEYLFPFESYTLTGDYNYGLDGATTGDIPGRKDMPWSKLSGYNKLTQRNIFHLENRPLVDDLTYQADVPLPSQIVIDTTESKYDELSHKYSRFISSGAYSVFTIGYKLEGVSIGTNTDAAGKLYVDAAWTGGGVQLNIYKDAGKTQRIAQETGLGYFVPGVFPIAFFDRYGYGLSGVLMIQPRTTTVTDSYTISLDINDPWQAYRNDDSRVFMTFYKSATRKITLVVTDPMGNAFQNALVYASCDNGSLNYSSRRTNRSGIVEFTYNSTGLSTGVAMDTVRFAIPKSGATIEAKIDIVGCS